ncbi:PREDICTED: interleukin-19 isoform X3 [Capra hircus]|uniref:interleukin-19 isoform X3 n=1 Tax=Capra hircus TaxID=9925 RepID=UPI0008471B02|nr:PREDICTED: interleukin-19 isoform X3 [Capra hircus]
MKALCVSLCLLGAGLFLCSVHARGLRRCLISTNLHRMEESFRGIKTAIPLDVCCVTKNLLAFYVDRVFKDHQELNPQIMRKISSLANSFLYMQKTLQQCGGDKTDLAPALQAFPALVTCKKLCHCRQEATNATRIIHDNYDQLEVRAAAVKSLGELDVFLAWIDKHHQGTSAASRQGT